jgi:hypothetical protein
MIKTQTCYTVACDSCGKELEHEWIPHWPVADDARSDALESEWVSNGTVDLCFECRYEPHPFALEPNTTEDCWRCSNPAEEH